MVVAPLEAFCRTHGSAIRRLRAEAKPERWALSETDFASALHQSAANRFARPPEPSAGEVERYLGSLYAEDLALAAACERGHPEAWTDFVARFRPSLLEAARRLTRDQARAEEMADSLYADLYGLQQADGRRRSLLAYFHGRSSLATWLHSVVSRAYVDDYRALRRSEELKERVSKDPSAAPAAAADVDPDRKRYVEALRLALQAALAELEPRDRLRLSYYHLQELTLLQIGRLLGEHESTVSRNLERVRRAVRSRVETSLRGDHGLSADEVASCFEYAVEDGPSTSRKSAERCKKRCEFRSH